MPARLLAVRVSALLALLLSSAPSLSLEPARPAREPLSEEIVRSLVQELDRELTQRLETATRRSEAGKGLPPGLADRAAELRRQLETIRAEAVWLPEPARGTWLGKLDRLEPLLHNLELTARLGHARGALPRGALARSPFDALRLEGLEPASALSVVPSDSCLDAPDIGYGTFTGDTSTATPGGDVSCGSSLFSPDVWFRLTVPFFDLVSIDTFGSSYDTVLSLHTACPAADQNLLQCNDDAFGTASLVSRFADPGEVYYVRVSGFNGASGPFVLHAGAEEAVIRGRASDEVTGELQGGVEVDVLSPEGFFRGFGFTDSTGRYTVTHLAGGAYTLRAEKDGFISEFYDDVHCPGGSLLACVEDATPVAVPSVGTVEGIDFTLSKGGTVSGRVADAVTGDPVPNAQVALYRNGIFSGSAFTDSTGAYSISALVTGTYRAVTVHQEYAIQLYQDVLCSGLPPGGCPLDTGTAVDVVEGATTSGIDFRLTQRGRITGTVRDAVSQTAISGATVVVFSSNGFQAGSAVTDSQGEYTVSGLLEGTYTARASRSGYAQELYLNVPCISSFFSSCDVTSGTPISVADAATTSEIDFTLAPLGTLSGRVTSAASGLGLSFYRVNLYSSGGKLLDDFFTSSDGSYSQPLVPGGYFVRTDDFGSLRDELFDDIPCEPSCSVTEGTLVTIESNVETSGVDFALEAVSSISGRVTDAAGGAAVEGVEVRLYSRFGSLRRSTTTDATGAYFFAVEPDMYFPVAFPDAPLVGELYGGASCPSIPPCEPELEGTSISLSLGTHLTGIDFALDAASTLAGTVTDIRTGEALAGHEVDLWNGRGRFLKAVLTTTAGTYQFVGLGPDTYFVSTRGAAADLVDELYHDVTCFDDGTFPACEVTKGTPIRITGGGQAVGGIDFHLDPITGPVGDIFSDGFESGDFSAWTVVVP